MSPASRPNKWFYILLSVGNLTGLVLFLGAACLLVISQLFNLLSLPTGQTNNPGEGFLLASGLCLCALAFIPAGIFSLQLALGKPPVQAHIRLVNVWQVVAIGGAWIGSSLLSDFIYKKFGLYWLAAGPFYLAAICLPIAGLVWIGLGGLPLGSLNRFWNCLSLSLSIAPMISALLEFGLGLGLLILGIIVFLFHPDWLANIQQLIIQLSNLTDFEKGTQLLAPYLLNPVAITAMFLVMSVFIPLIEEAVKPLVVWASGRRLESPAEGFAMGVLSGAGFAIVEGLVSASSPSQDWGSLLLARAGGSLMHITATGLMGWAIVSAWHGKRLRLVWIYLASISLHGLWNASAVLGILTTLQTYIQSTSSNSLANTLSLAAGGIIAVIVPVILVVLFLVNRHLRSTFQMQSDIIPPLANQN